MKEHVIDLLSLYVAFLRSLYSLNQSHHWRCKGTNFYANHLLFERLYQDNQKWADMAAEKTLGVFHQLRSQFEAIDEISRTYAEINDPIESSLQACKGMLALSNEVKKTLNKAQAMTPGFEDMIMEIDSQLETHVYLLSSSKEGGFKSRAYPNYEPPPVKTTAHGRIEENAPVDEEEDDEDDEGEPLEGGAPPEYLEVAQPNFGLVR